MKRLFMIIMLLIFGSMCFLLAQEKDVTNASIEIYYCPVDFNKKAVKGRKIYKFEGSKYILIYKGSQSSISRAWIEKMINSLEYDLTREEVDNKPKPCLDEGYFRIAINYHDDNYNFYIDDNFGYIYDEKNDKFRKCDILNDIYAYFAKEKFKDFGLGSINVYYDINCNPYQDGIPEK